MKYITILSLMILMLFSCEKELDNQDDDNTIVITKQYQILLYMRPSCGGCTQLEIDMDEAEIEYTAYNIDENEAKKQEMLNKLTNAGVSGSDVMLPVVDLILSDTNYLMIQPTLDNDILPLLVD